MQNRFESGADGIVRMIEVHIKIGMRAVLVVLHYLPNGTGDFFIGGEWNE